MYDIVHQAKHGIQIDDDKRVKHTNQSSDTESVWTYKLIEKKLKDESSC